MNLDKCAVCELDLDQEGNCPDGHTDDDGYGVIVGAQEMDDRDYLIHIINRTEECPKCHTGLDLQKPLYCSNCGFNIDDEEQVMEVLINQ